MNWKCMRCELEIDDKSIGNLKENGFHTGFGTDTKQPNKGIPYCPREGCKESILVQTPTIKHEGKKYLRQIYSAAGTPIESDFVFVDVYEVLVAFDVTCPAIQHAIKKLLACGQREARALVWMT